MLVFKLLLGIKLSYYADLISVGFKPKSTTSYHSRLLIVFQAGVFQSIKKISGINMTSYNPTGNLITNFKIEAFLVRICTECLTIANINNRW